LPKLYYDNMMSLIDKLDKKWNNYLTLKIISSWKKIYY
jgi:hypothetical protein